MSTLTLVRPTEKTADRAGAEMATIHSAFRRELRLAPGLLRAVEPGDRLRANLVATHLDFIDRFLHHHHTIEDDLLWPTAARARAEEIAPMVELMETQHHVVAQLLEQTVTRRAAWRKTASPADAAILADTYAQLHVSLVEHLDAEEMHVMPLVQSCITHKEWDAIGKRAQRSTPLKDGSRILGMLAYDGDPEVIDEMVASIPQAGPQHRLQDGAARVRQARHARLRRAYSVSRDRSVQWPRSNGSGPLHLGSATTPTRRPHPDWFRRMRVRTRSTDPRPQPTP